MPSQREPFIPCLIETYGGVNHGGTTCAGGLRVREEVQYSKDPEGKTVSLYGGHPQRVAARCQCLLDWMQRNPRPEAV